MAFHSRALVATASSGVYFSRDFSGPTGDMSTWTAVNGGLASLSMSGLGVDPAGPDDLQYALAAGVVYRRMGGDWEVILTVDQSRALAGGVATSSVHCLAVDPITGYIHLGFSAGDYYNPAWPYAISSQDHGETWSAVQLDSSGRHYWHDCTMQVDAYDGRVAYCQYMKLSDQMIYYSSDSGATFSGWNSEGFSAYPMFIHVSRYDTDSVYVNRFDGVDGGAYDLYQVSVSAHTSTLIQGDKTCGPFQQGGIWSSAENGKMATLAHHLVTKFWRTSDDWVTLVEDAPANTSPANLHYICPQSEWGAWILGRGDGQGGGCICASADGVTFTDRSGANNATSPYTDSIPDTCGGIVSIAAWTPNPIAGPPPAGTTLTPPGGSPITLTGPGRVQAVSLPGYTGVDRSIPMPGDRAAFDVDNYPEEHAADLHESTPTYHNPWPMAAGEAAVSDGTKLAPTEIATQDELDTHEGTPDAHHDPVTLGAGNDADMLTIDGQEIEGHLKDHAHAGVAGDGGQIELSAQKSTGATANQVATADGADGVSWQTPQAVGEYRQFVYAPDGLGSFSFVVDASGLPVFALLELE